MYYLSSDKSTRLNGILDGPTPRVGHTYHADRPTHYTIDEKKDCTLQCRTDEEEAWEKEKKEV